MKLTDPYKLHNIKIRYSEDGVPRGQVFLDGKELPACRDVAISIAATKMPCVTLTLYVDSVDVEVGALGGDIDVKK